MQNIYSMNGKIIQIKLEKRLNLKWFLAHNMNVTVNCSCWKCHEIFGLKICSHTIIHNNKTTFSFWDKPCLTNYHFTTKWYIITLESLRPNANIGPYLLNCWAILVLHINWNNMRHFSGLTTQYWNPIFYVFQKIKT